MGIKYVHIVFIAIATLFGLGFGVWVFATKGAPFWMGAAGIAMGVSLAVYGAFFIRKARRLL